MDEEYRRMNALPLTHREPIPSRNENRGLRLMGHPAATNTISVLQRRGRSRRSSSEESQGISDFVPGRKRDHSSTMSGGAILNQINHSD